MTMIQELPASRTPPDQEPEPHAHHSGCPVCQESWAHPTEADARQSIILHAATVHGVLIKPAKITAESCPACQAVAA